MQKRPRPIFEPPDVTGLSGRVLPIHPQPKEDEIFSSWLCRIAHANGLKLHTLEVQIWGRTKQIWTRDIDRSIDEHTLATVAELAGTPLERARETCLQSLEGKLFERLVVKSNSDWVLPLGVYHRKRKRPAMQFCPLCLAEDESAYYRRSWRLALSTFCTLHDTLLHECCPQCLAPVMFHRQELGDRWLTRIASFTLCTNCGYDLRLAPASVAPILEQGAWAALKRQRIALSSGWFTEGPMTFQYSHHYFDVVRNLIQKMRGRWSTSRLLTHATVMFEAPQPISERFNQPFEYFDVRDRHLFLQVATWYLQDWPHRFIKTCRELKIRYSEIMREFSPPFWFAKEASQLGFKPIGPSAGELNSMRALLMQDSPPQQRKALRRMIKMRLANNSIPQLLNYPKR